MRRRITIALLFLIGCSLHAQNTAPRSSSDIALALKKLNVLGSVLYIGAHPDDENTALLAAFAKGRCYRTAYLSITRGEGGQNLVGPEQGSLLGMIRTQELLGARSIDGAEQLFTRAIDFGFSKTTDETLRFWGHDSTLADIVWIIRTFQPDVIISRFTPVLGGHGNHTASALLAQEAFHAAADSKKFPEQLQYTKPWRAKRLVWNVFRFSPADSIKNANALTSIDVGAYSPLLGKSFNEIAGEARSMHKSQGFGAAQNRGASLQYFQHVAGDSAHTDLLDGIAADWSRVDGGSNTGAALAEAARTYAQDTPERSLPFLVRAYTLLPREGPDRWVELKRAELIQAILACAGLWADAVTPEASVVPGRMVTLSVGVVNRSNAPLSLERIILPFDGCDTVLSQPLAYNKPLRNEFQLTIPENAAITQPYWLVQAPHPGAYVVADQQLIGKPENGAAIPIRLTFALSGVRFTVTIPLRQRVVDPVDGELLKPFSIVPPAALNLQERTLLFADRSPRTVGITVRAMTANLNGVCSLRVPDGWRVSPEQIPVSISQKNDEANCIFTVTPSPSAHSGTFSAQLRTAEGGVVRTGTQQAIYRHIPPQTMFPEAEGKLLRTDIAIRGTKAAYIMGAGDEIPAAMRQLGYSVTLLSDNDIAGAPLDGYDVIVAGVRSYNTRPQLRLSHKRFIEYATHGGTYLVMYMTSQRSESDSIGAYPLSVSRDRVAEEDAPVTFLAPDHPLLTTPNRITQDDFSGWIQERGLSFADKWDPRYETVLSCHDINEPARNGGLLTARVGKGRYIYCGYALFRQLPAGVEGAYRLFANLLARGE